MDKLEQQRDGLQTDDRLLDAIEGLVAGFVTDYDDETGEASEAYHFWADGYFENFRQSDLIAWLNKNAPPDDADDAIHWGATGYWATVENGQWIQNKV